MSKAYLAEVIHNSADMTAELAYEIAGDVLDSLRLKLKKDGKLTFPGFGTFTVHKTKARAAMNPRTGEKIRVKAGKTVRFKASPLLKKGI